MRKMIGSSVTMSGLLLWAVAASCAFSLTLEEEFKTYSLWRFNAKVKLLNDWNDVLKKAVSDYQLGTDFLCRYALYGYMIVASMDCTQQTSNSAFPGTTNSAGR